MAGKRRACESGSNLEDNTYLLLAEYFDGRNIKRNAPYTSFYGNGQARTEFAINVNWIIETIQANSARIEVKNQNIAGSVDEKLPDMLCKFWGEKYPEPVILFVLNGEGYKAGAKEWFKRCIENPEGFFKEMPTSDINKVREVYKRKRGYVFFDLESLEQFIKEQEDSAKIVSQMGGREDEVISGNIASHTILR